MAVMNRNSIEYQIFRLTGEFSHTVRDPLWRDIPLSDGFKELFQCEPMQKLSRIKQLGPAHLLYPGAVHTRADHSLGVYHVTRLIILSLLGKDCPISFPHEDIQALLAAAMLHDLGHFPYAHALKDLIPQEHEALGAAMIATHPQLRTIIEQRLETSVDTVCRIIDPNLPADSSTITFFRSILSGTLDPDKLDYLSRDALFCGIPYGMQDASYIIRNLTVTDDALLAMPLEAIGAVEHLLFAKYAMYRNVYWHHVTRGATAMIKKAVTLGLSGHYFSEEDLFDLDDESFAALFARASGTGAGSLFAAVRGNRLFRCLATAPYSDAGTYGLGRHRLLLEQAIFDDLAPRYPTLGPHEVIVDIPEEISFESDIPILREDGSHAPFKEIDELFNADVVQAFVGSLRKVRLYLPWHIDGNLARKSLEGNLSHHA